MPRLVQRQTRTQPSLAERRSKILSSRGVRSMDSHSMQPSSPFCSLPALLSRPDNIAAYVHEYNSSLGSVLDPVTLEPGSFSHCLHPATFGTDVRGLEVAQGARLLSAKRRTEAQIVGFIVSSLDKSNVRFCSSTSACTKLRRRIDFLY